MIAVIPRHVQRRYAIARCIRRAAAAIPGIREKADKSNWAASRKAAGWSPQLVEQAVSSGPLSIVRDLAADPYARRSPSVDRSVRAYAIIDSGVSIETVIPHYTQDR